MAQLESTADTTSENSMTLAEGIRSKVNQLGRVLRRGLANGRFDRGYGLVSTNTLVAYMGFAAACFGVLPVGGVAAFAIGIGGPFLLRAAYRTALEACKIKTSKELSVGDDCYLMPVTWLKVEGPLSAIATLENTTRLWGDFTRAAALRQGPYEPLAPDLEKKIAPYLDDAAVAASQLKVTGRDGEVHEIVFTRHNHERTLFVGCAGLKTNCKL